MAKKARLLSLGILVLTVFSLNPSWADEIPQKAEEKKGWGIGVKGGYFGVPDFVLDRIFEEHPSVSGSTFGIEARYYGRTDKVFNLSLSLDYGTFSSDGYWRKEAADERKYGKIEGSLVSLTATAIWNILPTKTVNPYLGIGLGVGQLKGTGKSEDEEESVSATVPVLHIPLGINIRPSDRFHIDLEGGFRDGIYGTGGLRILF
jgi:opacity protein-like surface antigen